MKTLNSKNEMWKNIKDFEGLYQINKCGQIKSLSKKLKRGSGVYLRKEIILNNWTSTSGYKITALCKNRTRHFFLIHRLVAQTFIPNVENKKEVNHINGIKSDHRIENLEWVTHNENMTHAIKKELWKPNRSTSKKVINTENGKVFNSGKLCYNKDKIKEKYKISYRTFLNQLSSNHCYKNKTIYKYE